MNIYEKLNAARLRFLKSGAKKSGYNSFAKYSYFELSDILPVINQAAQEIKFTCVVNFGDAEATLAFIDAEKPEDRIVFNSPMSTAELKNNHPIQNLGAMQTYIRRYLYLMAFEITEHDAIDLTAGKDAAKSAGAQAPQQQQQSPSSAGAGEPPKPTSAEMQAEIERVLTAKHPDGSLVFNEDDKKRWWRRFKANPSSAIFLAKKALEERSVAWGADHP